MALAQGIADIFINYRREGSSERAGRLSRDLGASLGDDEVFADIEPGIDFTGVIEKMFASLDVPLVVRSNH